jgi:hypothetical protein
MSKEMGSLAPAVTRDNTEVFKFTELEVQKLNLQPSDVLMVTIKHEDVSQEDLQFVQKKLETLFPNNKVMSFAMGEEGYIKFTIASTSNASYTNYCNNCDCGKKETAEQENKK